MTVAALSPSIDYLEDGVTLAFAAPFRFDAGALRVSRLVAGVETVLVPGAAYSVTGGENDSGGTVTLVATVAGARLLIRRLTPRSQLMDYTPTDRFPAESHERALDRLAMIAQEQDVGIGEYGARAVKAALGEAGPTLPLASARAGKVLGFGADPNVLLALTMGGGDGALRTDLASLLAGASIVAFAAAGLDAFQRSVLDKLREIISSDDRPFNPAPLQEAPGGYQIRGNWGLGSNILTQNIGGFNSFAMGYGALAAAEYVRSAIAIGNGAQQSVVGDQTGARALVDGGPEILSYFSNGDANIAIGDFVLRDNLTGTENLGIGANCLQQHTTGSCNVAIGGNSQITGVDTNFNVSLGAYCLTVNQGSNNIAIGWAALEGQLAGSNIAIGHVAMNGNKTGSLNIAIGPLVLLEAETPTENVVIGQEAAKNVTDLTSSVVIGAFAVGSSSGAPANIVAIGRNALLNCTGDGNTAIGAGASSTITNLINTTALGAGANPTKSDQAVIGNDNVVEVILPRITIPNLVYAVGGLPTAASVGVGARAFVSDSNVPAAGNFGAVVVGGGANKVPVYSDGTNWRIG